MKEHKSQTGSSAIALVLVTIVLCVLGFAGWKVYDNKSTKLASSTTSTVPVAKEEPKQEEPKIPEGFVEYESQELGFKFAYPKEWGQVEKTETSNDIIFKAVFSATKVAGTPLYNVSLYANSGRQDFSTGGRGGALWDCVGFIKQDQNYACRMIYIKDGKTIEQVNTAPNNPKLIKTRNTEVVTDTYAHFGSIMFESLVNLNGKYYGAVFVTDNGNQQLVKQLEQVSQTIEVL